MSIGSNVKRYRLEKNMTQAQLADAVCVRQSMIAQIERGSKIPTLPLSKAIVDVLGIQIEQLLDD